MYVGKINLTKVLFSRQFLGVRGNKPPVNLFSRHIFVCRENKLSGNLFCRHINVCRENKSLEIFFKINVYKSE